MFDYNFGVVSLTATAERFSRGEIAARAERRGPDEIVRLAAGFNAMAERIATDITDPRHAEARLR